MAEWRVEKGTVLEWQSSCLMLKPSHLLCPSSPTMAPIGFLGTVSKWPNITAHFHLGLVATSTEIYLESRPKEDTEGRVFAFPNVFRAQFRSGTIRRLSLLLVLSSLRRNFCRKVCFPPFTNTSVSEFQYNLDKGFA